MAVVETKFSIGDMVFYAGLTTERRQHSCPDCLGTKEWKATSPAGSKYNMSCPRCSRSYLSDLDLSLNYTAYAPCVQQMTIGQVRTETSRQNQYMCRETGVGSGSIYDEDRLFLAHEDAMAAAEAACAVQNATHTHFVQTYNRTLEISDYELGNAKIKLASEKEAAARSMVWSIEEMISAVQEAGDLEAAKEAVEDYRRWSLSRDRDKAGFVRSKEPAEEEVL